MKTPTKEFVFEMDYPEFNNISAETYVELNSLCSSDAKDLSIVSIISRLLRLGLIPERHANQEFLLDLGYRNVPLQNG